MPWILTLSKVFPLLPVPQVLRQRFMPPCSSALTESLRSQPSHRPVGRNSTFQGLWPLQRRPPGWPRNEAGCFMPTSVPLSGFLNPSVVLAHLSFAALFRAATVPGTSLQSVPLARIANPSRSSLASAVIHPRAVTYCLRRITNRFANSHAFARLPGFPGQLCPPFSPTRRSASRTSWARAMNSPLSASFTCFEACSSPRKSVLY
jgi:hypothetical protein